MLNSVQDFRRYIARHGTVFCFNLLLWLAVSIPWSSSAPDPQNSDPALEPSPSG